MPIPIGELTNVTSPVIEVNLVVGDVDDIVVVVVVVVVVLDSSAASTGIDVVVVRFD